MKKRRFLNFLKKNFGAIVNFVVTILAPKKKEEATKKKFVKNAVALSVSVSPTEIKKPTTPFDALQI